MKKFIPIGIDDFKKIITEEYYLIDKSLFIEELLMNRASVTLLPRPRRFGKTLNMSMLRYFFDVNNAEENRKLFDDLKISKNETCMKKQGQYPVIYLSLKDIKTNSWEECLEKIIGLISQLYKDSRYLVETLEKEDREEFEEIMSRKSSKDSLENSLFNLSKYMQQHYKKNVVILIDEYDTPIISAQEKNYYEEAISFFRNFYSTALKSNTNLEFGVMTGILRISKESIFSGLNNLVVSTILDDRYEHFGLSEIEVKRMLEDYEIPFTEEIRNWYNGYKFGSSKVYNPWSILNYVSQKKLKPYWVNTGSNELIKSLLARSNEKIEDDLKRLFNDEEVVEYITENITYSDVIENLDAFWSLMLFSGYLTYRDSEISGVSGRQKYLLKIPNGEVKAFFEEQFISIIAMNRVAVFYNMLDDLYAGNLEKFAKNFKELYFNAISYHDKADNEKYYHHFMLGLLLGLHTKYHVTSNRESGNGRYDILLEPKDKKDFGIIFELKTDESESFLKRSAQKALEQIEIKKYDADMKARGITKFLKIGMAFYEKQVEIEAVKE